MNVVVCLSAVAVLAQIPVVSTTQVYRAFATTRPGDAARGKAVFQREALACSTCHTLGEGSLRAGPDLLGIGDKYPRDELIRAVLEPSALILTGYASTTLATETGLVHAGIIARRDPQEVELLLPTNQRVRIASDTIVDERRSPVSLMPSGLHRLLTPQEFTDLIAFLATLKQQVSSSHSEQAVPAEIARVRTPVQFERFHSEEVHFERPIWFDAVPGTKHTYVVAQHNPPRVWLLEKGPSGDRKTLFLTLEGEAAAGQDTGILGMAFHPNFVSNRRYFVYHHLLEAGLQGAVIVERRASDDYRRDSGEPSRRLVHVKRWTVAHTGGVMVFGADGFLYVGIGDGGPQEDPEGNSQNLRLLLGSILRIDVDRRSDKLPYGIPASNPFVNHADEQVRKEIWAFGFRQPWRLSFDPVTQDLWVGDVGQQNYEEVSIVRAGENHGWNVYEGHVAFSDKYRQAGVQYVAPVISLLRKHGVSVTGGHVYRGKANPSYEGVYIFGDYESKRVWGLRQQNRKLKQIREMGVAPDRIVSFGVDAVGELFVVGYNTGTIYRLRLENSVFE